ncbi:MAG TPA: hypothetical protein VGC91_02400 [Pyrinomonadaceae bacterium]|jgi:hypothetical protein
MRKLAPFFASLLLLAAAPLLFVSTARAQAVADLTIDSGTLTIMQPVLPSTTFDFAGRQLSVQSSVPSDDIFIWPNCTPCLGGDTFNVHGSITTSRRGSATISGVSRDIYITTVLTLSGGNVTIPYRYSRLPIRVTVPTTVTGRLTGYTRDPNAGDPGPEVFHTPVSLQGTATLTLIFRGTFAMGFPIYSAQSIVYNLARPTLKTPAP